MPKGIQNKIDTIRRNFLWGKNKLHLTNWHTVTRTKQQGGLGITSLEHRNLSMFGKNWWHVKTNKACKWLKVLKSKYGHDLSKWTNQQNRNTKSMFITSMTYLSNHICTKGLFDNNNYKWQSHTGNCIMFWEDAWALDTPLSTTYPRNYRLSRYKFVSISNMIHIWEQTTSPQELWHKELHTLEEIEAQGIYDILQNHRTTTGEDVLIWKHNNKAYNTADMYRLINTNNSFSISRWSFLWDLKVPPKIRIFVWKLCNKILPTKHFLARRLTNYNIHPYCTQCNTENENVKHIFKDCRVAKQCWRFLENWRVSVDMQNNTEDWLWRSYMVANKLPYKEHWQVTLSAMLWTLWTSRNEFIFQNKINTQSQLEFLISHRSYLWCSNNGLIHIDSENNWRSNPVRTTKLWYTFMIKELTYNWDYFAFVDGSWATSGGMIKSGVGGYIKTKNNNRQFIFSGPTRALTPLQAETNALLVVLREIHSNISRDNRVVVYTDAHNLYHNIQLYRAGRIRGVPFAENIDMDLYNFINIEHINRLHNRGADYLAKTGAHKPNIIMGWT